MVWNTPQEEEIMGRKPGPIQEPGPQVLSTQTPHYVELPTYARLQLTRRMADDLRRLASQIEFNVNRSDLHMTRRLHLIHLEFRTLNRRWLDELQDAKQYSARPAKSGNTKYSIPE